MCDFEFGVGHANTAEPEQDREGAGCRAPGQGLRPGRFPRCHAAPGRHHESLSRSAPRRPPDSPLKATLTRRAMCVSRVRLTCAACNISHRAETRIQPGAILAPWVQQEREAMGQFPSPALPQAATRSWTGQDGHHYTVGELAEAWNVSTDFIRDLFRDEVDVLRWARSRPGKRRYVVLRI